MLSWQKVRFNNSRPLSNIRNLTTIRFYYHFSLFLHVRNDSPITQSRYRGYYMAARRYEISLQVLKNIRERVKYFFQHEKRNFVSPNDHVIFYLLYKHQWNTKPFYYNRFWYERRDLLCSHSNGDIFTCEDIKFSRESSLGISLVFI